ncbi:conserved Plasmodium protein, unknown function, partial [Plasmodium ovale curtisi]
FYKQNFPDLPVDEDILKLQRFEIIKCTFAKDNESISNIIEMHAELEHFMSANDLAYSACNLHSLPKNRAKKCRLVYDLKTNELIFLKKKKKGENGKLKDKE